jgi:hypothetical protein
VTPIVESLRRDSAFLPGDLVYLVGLLRGLSTGAVEFRAVPGQAGWAGAKSIVEMDPSAYRLFDAIREGRSIANVKVGVELLETPVSEANTDVAVIDENAEAAATEVHDVLSQAGFDVTPGIWDAAAAPAGIEGPAIVFAPGADAYAQVVSGYFPDLRTVVSDELQGARVAIWVTSSYEPSEPGSASGSSQCPTPST